MATRFFNFTCTAGLSLNPTKTQLMVTGTKCSDIGEISICACPITPTATLNLLGLKYDCNLTTAPYLHDLEIAAKARSGLISRLSHQLPPYLLRGVAQGLVYGKVTYATAAAIIARTQEDDHVPNGLTEIIRNIQVTLNDVTCTVAGVKRTDRKTLTDLRAATGFPSLNSAAVRAAAMQAWTCINTRDHVASLMLSKNEIATGHAMPSRATTAGCLRLPLRGQTQINTLTRLWNQCTDLRSACTKSQAATAAIKIARSAPD